MTSPMHPPSPFADEDQDIASTMGFASFGAKPNPPKKKRKIGNANSTRESSGSNSTPLGIRQRNTRGQAPNMELAQRDWEVEVEGQSGGREECDVEDVMGGNRKVMGAKAHIEDGLEFEDKGPAYIVGDEEIRTQYGTTDPVMAPPIPREVANAGTGAGGLEPGRRADGQWDWQALRRGVRDARGDMAFYDASFVEDPWEHLVGGKESGT